MTSPQARHQLVRGIAAGDVSDCAGHRTRSIGGHQDRCIRHFRDPGQSLEQGSLRKTSLERLPGNASQLSKLAEKLVQFWGIWRASRAQTDDTDASRSEFPRQLTAEILDRCTGDSKVAGVGDEPAGRRGGDGQDHARPFPAHVPPRCRHRHELGRHGVCDRLGELRQRHFDEWGALHIADPDRVERNINAASFSGPPGRGAARQPARRVRPLVPPQLFLRLS